MNLLQSKHGRKLLFAALYASEGAPIGYIWWALPTKMKIAGVPDETIPKIAGLLVLPWALKFLWAPAVDAFRGPRWGVRSWIVSSQFLMGFALIPVVQWDLAEHLNWITVLLFVHAFFAATQDASVDALCIASVPADQRGEVNGWMQVGMLGSRAVFGGGALLLEKRIGPDWVLGALIGCVWLSTILVLFATREPERGEAEPLRPVEARRFGKTLTTALSSRNTWLGLAFAAIAGAGFEAVGATAGPLLIDWGSRDDAVGTFFSLPVILCMSGGALIGGHLSDRLGRRCSTVLSLLFMVSAVLLIAAFARWTTDLTFAYGGLGLVYVAIGAFTAASYALFMALTDPRLGATQFSAFMGATNLCEAWAAYGVGKLSESYSYPTAYVVMAAVSMISIIFLFALELPKQRRPVQ